MIMPTPYPQTHMFMHTHTHTHTLMETFAQSGNAKALAYV